MSISTFLFNLMLIVISASTPVVTHFIIRFLQEKIGSEKFKMYTALAERSVKAVETIYKEKGAGAFKKADVEQYLLEKTEGKLTLEDIDKLIESIVYEIGNTGKSMIFDTPPTEDTRWTTTRTITNISNEKEIST